MSFRQRILYLFTLLALATLLGIRTGHKLLNDVTTKIADDLPLRTTQTNPDDRNRESRVQDGERDQLHVKEPIAPQLVPVPQLNVNRSRFVVIVCRNCRLQTYNETHKCGEILKKNRWDTLIHSTMQWPEALTMMKQVSIKTDIASTPKCEKCHPSVCKLRVEFPNPEDSLRLDEVCPPIQQAVSHELASIPTKFQDARFDPQAYEQTTSAVRPLFTYNPTIQRYSSEFYIASFRVGNFPWLDKDSSRTDYPYRDYLGLAILDEYLGIVVDAVFDVNEFDGYVREVVGKFSDYRLVVHDHQFYLSNDVYLWRVDIEFQPSLGGVASSSTATGDTSKFLIPPLYSCETCNGTIQLWVHGSKAVEIEGLRNGRNYNFFDLDNRWFLEEWPLPRLSGSYGGRHVSEIEERQTGASTISYKVVSSLEGYADPESLFIGDERRFTKKPYLYRISNSRGTACCLKLEREYYEDMVFNSTVLAYDYVMVGIAHVKSRKRIIMTHGERFAYLSSFYAFAPQVPGVETLAQTGLFCWGFPSKMERSRLIQRRKLEWRREKGPYDCPVIQFPSGIVESISDQSKVIVAYGIDDEISRMVEIRKRDIALMLFSPVPWMGG